MSVAADHCDALVIGAGPAGSTAAQLLAAWGWSVVVVHRPGRAGSPSLAESLPPSIRKVFQFLGQLNDVEAAGFHPNDGNVARWANAPRATKTTDAGFHVSRRAFDDLLRSGARARGARIVDAVVRRFDDRDPAGATYETADGRIVTCHARYVLDCSGRAGIVARRGLRRADARYKTLAVAAEWECPGWPAEERAQTLIESYPEGWAWSVPLSATRRQCTVMIEPLRLGSPKRGTREGGSPACIPSLAMDERLAPHSIDQRDGGALPVVYRRELAKAIALSARLTNARQISAPWCCDASVYSAARAAEDRMVLVGDAASFIEPLSSAGVKKALLSGWRAAVVVNTSLSNPAMSGAAMDLHTRREQHVYGDCLRRSRAFFAEAAAVYGTRFWSSRAELADTAVEAIDVSDEATDADLAHDVEIRLAFDRLRATDHVRLRQADALRFEPVAAIEGREVVMRDALTCPGFHAPMQFAAGVNLPALARLARTCDEVPALLAAYQAQNGPAPIGGLLTGLSLLIARQALVAEESTP